MSTLSLKGTLLELPSKGLAYQKIQLINSSCVKVRKFTAEDQRHLAASATDLYKQYQVLLHAIVTEPESFIKNLEEVLVSDANTILYAVRMLSFGPDYQIPFVCTNCGANRNQNMSLMDATVTDAEEETFTPDELEFKAETFNVEKEEDEEHIIQLHLMRLKDERSISSTFRSMKEKNMVVGNDIDKQYLRLAQQITSIDGDSNLGIQNKFKFINSLSISSINKLVTFLSSKEIGINTTQNLICNECDWNNEVRLGMSKDFFPTK